MKSDKDPASSRALARAVPVYHTEISIAGSDLLLVLQRVDGRTWWTIGARRAWRWGWAPLC